MSGGHPLLDALVGWVFFFPLALSLGCAVSRWTFLRGGEPASPPTQLAFRRSTVARLGQHASMAAGVALLALGARQAVEFHDPFGSWRQDLVLLLSGTSWGRVWIGGIVAAALAHLGFRRAARDRSGGWVLATAGGLLLGMVPGLTGHAGGGDHGVLPLVADALHVWAMSGWIGGLGALLFLEWRQVRGPEPSASVLPDLVPRFSRLAMVCVATLLVTGIVAAWLHLGSVADLIHTRYGLLLLLKIGLVSVVLALGGLNWRRLTPHLGEPEGPRLLERAAMLELVVANVVLAVTAVLVRTPPP